MDFLVHHMLRTTAERFADKEALVQGTRRLTFAEFASQAAGVARGLREAGLRRGERVAVFLEASLEQSLAILGISQAGGVFVPIHHSLFPHQVEHILSDCDVTGLITDSRKLAPLQEHLPAEGAPRWVALCDPDSGEVSRLPQYSFAEWCAGEVASGWQDWRIGRDLAAILYTSGSTGKPKGVMLSHENLLAGAAIVSDYLHITSADRTLAVLPFSFDAGLNQLMTGIAQGAAVVLQDALFARDIVRALQAEQITGLAGVPPLWNLLVQPSSGLARAELPHLRYVTNTGGALPQTVLRRLREALPATQVYLMYGLTEAFRSTYLPPEEIDRRPGSIGKAIPNTEILIVNDEGRPCGPGEPGELVHHGPTVSLGYWGQPELTAQVLRPHPFPPPGLSNPPLVCYSGDLVQSDEEGFLYFLARRDNQIKSSGFRISPTEIEEVLCRSGLVQEAAVVGVPHEALGQAIVAYVRPLEGSEVDIEKLMLFCAENLPRHMLPKSVEVRDTFPKTSSGKIDYPALRRLAVASAEGSAAGRARP